VRGKRARHSRCGGFAPNATEKGKKRDWRPHTDGGTGKTRGGAGKGVSNIKLTFGTKGGRPGKCRKGKGFFGTDFSAVRQKGGDA